MTVLITKPRKSPVGEKKKHIWDWFCYSSPQFTNCTHTFLNCSLGLKKDSAHGLINIPTTFLSVCSDLINRTFGFLLCAHKFIIRVYTFAICSRGFVNCTHRFVAPAPSMYRQIHTGHLFRCGMHCIVFIKLYFS